MLKESWVLKFMVAALCGFSCFIVDGALEKDKIILLISGVYLLLLLTALSLIKANNPPIPEQEKD